MAGKNTLYTSSAMTVLCMLCALVGAQSGLGSAMCEYHDSECWNTIAVQYVNEIRANYGKEPLRLGTESMLQNAVKHSTYMLNTGDFNHQELSSVTTEIGCNIFCGAENIAYFSGQQSDPAKVCVDMWRNSPGHLQNILTDRNQLTVVGIAGYSGGRTYCTQTFGSADLSQLDALGSRSPQCLPSGSQSSGPPEPQQPPPEIPSTQGSGAQCTPSGARCAGEAGHEYVPYYGCCSPDDTCVADPRPGASWGRFCLPSNFQDHNSDNGQDVDGSFKSKQRILPNCTVRCSCCCSMELLT